MNAQETCHNIIRIGYQLGFNMNKIAKEVGVAKTSLHRYRMGEGNPKENIKLVLKKGEKKLITLLENRHHDLAS